MNHNRWIDPASPYHQRFRISGIAALDPAFWEEITTYLKANGSFCYEQDWLVKIMNNSPELSSTVDQGEEFLDNMANACKKQGLSIQYCMATPLCFLQGSKYDNLTSIRVSDDHFNPDRYSNFFYVSRLADSLGIWPFADVFQSTVASNALLSTLSAGPVGSGDAINAENKDTLMKIVRGDGVIVKPDVPVVPMDRAYLAEAQHKAEPILATTYTDHGGLKTIYLVACKNKPSDATQISVRAADLGVNGPYYFFNCLTESGTKITVNEDCPIDLRNSEYAFYMAAPITESGIAFLGDAGCFVGTGKKRISTLKSENGKLTATVLLAENERKITLRGYAVPTPQVKIQGGIAGPVTYDALTGLFNVTVQPDLQIPAIVNDGDSVRQLMITLNAVK